MKLSTFDAVKQLKSETNSAWITLSDEQVKQLQEVEVLIAKDIIDFCDENNIRVYLGGGSALGAMRHNGFIPWDDDIDLNMPRADYNRFIKLFSEKYKEKYWIHTPKSGNGYVSLATKIAKKGTVMRQFTDGKNEECGVCVDIFVIENTYNNKFCRKVHSFFCKAVSFIVTSRRIYQDKEYYLNYLFRNQTELHKVLKIRAGIGKVMSFMSLDTWLKLGEKIYSCCKNDNSKYVAIPTGRESYEKSTHLRESFLKVRRVPFDKFNWPITDDAEKYLSRLYGNYMEIPPVEKREKHVLLEFKL